MTTFLSAFAGTVATLKNLRVFVGSKEPVPSKAVNPSIAADVSVVFAYRIQNEGLYPTNADLKTYWNQPSTYIIPCG